MTWVKEFLSLASRWFVAGVFLLASHDKVWEPAAFADAVGRYDLLPMALVNAASVWLAWLEFVIGLLLVVGFWARAAAVWAVGLLLFFTGLMVYSGLTGAGFDCGCFPGQEGHPAGFETALRDVAFLAPAVWALISPGRWLAAEAIAMRKTTQSAQVKVAHGEGSSS